MKKLTIPLCDYCIAKLRDFEIEDDVYESELYE